MTDLDELITQEVEGIRDRLRNSHQSLDNFERALAEGYSGIRDRLRRIHHNIDIERDALNTELHHLLNALTQPMLPPSEDRPINGHPPLPHEMSQFSPGPRFLDENRDMGLRPEDVDDDRYSFRQRVVNGAG